MGLSNADRQTRWRIKRNAEIERLRQVVAEQDQHLIKARNEIEIAALERENARLKMALAHERKQHEEAKARAAKPTSPPIYPDGEMTRRLPDWLKLIFLFLAIILMVVVTGVWLETASP